MGIPRVVLPSLRVAHAREVFRSAIDDDDKGPLTAFSDAIDALEVGSYRWGLACPECGTCIGAFNSGSDFACPVHGKPHQGAVLLIGWDPVVHDIT